MISFADRVRDELVAVPLKKPCCRRALCAGLLLGAAGGEGGRVCARFPAGEVAAYAESTFRGQFGKGLTVTRQNGGRSTCDLVFSSPATQKLLHAMRYPEEAERLTSRCENCRSAFLRGAFLAVGTVNDPHRSIHLEFLIRVPEHTGLIRAVLTDCGYPPHITRRESGTGLYYKDGASVEDLIALTGAGRVAMELMNIRFERQLRGEENRATNCMTRNIAKTVSAAVRQVEAIRILREGGRLGQLPDGVRQTADLREQNPEASLEELRAMHIPPITKSGLNHRLKRILDEAEGKQITKGREDR